CTTFHSLDTYLFISSFIFFFNDPATPALYTLSLHDALPIPTGHGDQAVAFHDGRPGVPVVERPRFRISAEISHEVLLPDHRAGGDRKSTRLNSSHVAISYAVFCLKKKKYYV